MAKVNEIYKCSDCDCIVETLFDGKDKLHCSGKPMELQVEKTKEDGLAEKHKPVIEKQADGAIIKIGASPHAMEPEHYIEWVEVIEDKKLCRHSLQPGEKPEVRSYQKDHSYVRAYCNIHGLWKN